MASALSKSRSISTKCCDALPAFSRRMSCRRGSKDPEPGRAPRQTLPPTPGPRVQQTQNRAPLTDCSRVSAWLSCSSQRPDSIWSLLTMRCSRSNLGRQEGSEREMNEGPGQLPPLYWGSALVPPVPGEGSLAVPGCLGSHCLFAQMLPEEYSGGGGGRRVVSHQPCVSHYGWAGPTAVGREPLPSCLPGSFPRKRKCATPAPAPPSFPLGALLGAPACLSNSERRSFSLSRMATCSLPHSFSTSSGW